MKRNILFRDLDNKEKSRIFKAFANRYLGKLKKRNKDGEPDEFYDLEDIKNAVVNNGTYFPKYNVR